MAKRENLKLYQSLFSHYKNVNQSLTHSELDIRVAAVWKSMKSQDSFPDNVKTYIEELRGKAETKKRHLIVTGFVLQKCCN